MKNPGSKVSVRPDPITVGDYTARPFMAESGGVSEWRVTDRNANVVATLTAEQFAAEGQAMLEAWQRGESFTHTVTVEGKEMPRKLAWQKRRELLVEGRDQTLQVEPFVRDLAGLEADEHGVFRQALERHQVEQWPGLERELFASLYGNPEPVETLAEGDQWLQAIHQQAEQLEEWQGLRRQSEGDPWAAGIGAGRVTRALGAVLDEAIRKLAPQADPERLKEEAKALEELAEGAGAVMAKAAGDAELQAAALAAKLGSGALELKVRQAIRKAAAEAEEELDELQVAMTGLGVGTGPGVLGAVPASRDEVRKALQADPKLRRVAEIAGRMRMRARKVARSKVAYLPELIVDVTLGGELERLLPSELTLLAAEETELLEIRKLAERQALQYRLEGREQMDRGPVILAVDGSGSMEGARNEWAMGVALAVIEVAHKQRRPFALVHFDHVVQRVFEVPAGKPCSFPELVEMVSYFSGGGTSFAEPLQWAAGKVSEPGNRLGEGTWKQADVILVTDGRGDWGPAMGELKAKGAQVYGVAIEACFKPEQAKELAGLAQIRNLAEHEKPKPKGALQDGAVDLVFGI